MIFLGYHFSDEWNGDMVFIIWLTELITILLTRSEEDLVSDLHEGCLVQLLCVILLVDKISCVWEKHHMGS